jgi:hypothetical protein
VNLGQYAIPTVRLCTRCARVAEMGYAQCLGCLARGRRRKDGKLTKERAARAPLIARTLRARDSRKHRPDEFARCLLPRVPETIAELRTIHAQPQCGALVFAGGEERHAREVHGCEGVAAGMFVPVADREDDEP